MLSEQRLNGILFQIMSLHVQVKPHPFFPFQQPSCPLDVILVNMHIAQVERDGLQRQIYLPGHQVEMIEVGRQSKVGIGTALVGRQYQFPVLYLELHQTKAWGLVAFRVRGTKEQNVILAATLFLVDFGHQWR